MCLLMISFQYNTKWVCMEQESEQDDISALQMHGVDAEELNEDSWESGAYFVPCSLFPPQHFIFDESRSTIRPPHKQISWAVRKDTFPLQQKAGGQEILVMVQVLPKRAHLKSLLSPPACSSTKLGWESSLTAQRFARCVVELNVFMFAKRK